MEVKDAYMRFLQVGTKLIIHADAGISVRFREPLMALKCKLFSIGNLE